MILVAKEDVVLTGLFQDKTIQRQDKVTVQAVYSRLDEVEVTQNGHQETLELNSLKLAKVTFFLVCLFLCICVCQNKTKTNSNVRYKHTVLLQQL